MLKLNITLKKNDFNHQLIQKLKYMMERNFTICDIIEEHIGCALFI